MKKQKPYFKRIVLLSLILFSSCNKDNIDTLDTASEEQIYKKEKSTGIPSFISSISNQENNAKNNVNTESDLTTYLNLINPNDVIIIEDENGVKNYTFTLDLVEEGKLTNLVVQDNNGSYTYNLIEYTADDMEQWLDDVYVNESTLNTATASVTDLGKVTPPMCTTMEFTCPSGNHGSGSYDSCYYKDLTMWSYHIVPTSCDDGGGGSGGEGPITDPSNPSGGGGSSNPVIITTPTKTLQPWEEVLDCLTGIGLNGEIAWLQNNKRGAGQILNYLQENECSADAQGVALQALDAFMNGGEVDFDFEMIIEINETIEFQSQTCLKTIKDDVIATNQMSDIIKKFEPENPVLHLEWGIFQSDNWGNTGHTGLDDTQTLAYININSESLSYVSNIVMVKTIAHEIIHAELYRKLKEIVDDYQILSLAEYNALEDNYLGIADYTFSYGTLEYSQSLMGNVVTWGLTPNYSEAHHNQMASFYRSVLIDTMKAYDLSKNIIRDNSEQFYEAMSWAGLRSFSDESGNTQFYDAWEKFKDSIDILENIVPEPERTYNIFSNIINEQYNNSGINCN